MEGGRGGRRCPAGRWLWAGGDREAARRGSSGGAAETLGRCGSSGARGWEGRRDCGPRRVVHEGLGNLLLELRTLRPYALPDAPPLASQGRPAAAAPSLGAAEAPPPSLRSPRPRSAAGTGASLCRIRAEPLPTLKPEPRALAALWRVGIKRLPRTPWGKGPRRGPGSRGCSPLSRGSVLPVCEPDSWQPDGEVRQTGQFCPCSSSSSLLAADSREGERRGGGQGQGCCLPAVSPSPWQAAGVAVSSPA